VAFARPSRALLTRSSNELKPFFDLGVGEYVSICSGFDNKCKYQITHHEGMTIFSGHTMTDIGQGAGYFSNARGPTVDQVAAKAIGSRTAIPSLQLGCITADQPGGLRHHDAQPVAQGSPAAAASPIKNPQAAFLSIAGLFARSTTRTSQPASAWSTRSAKT
jgi:hypothetical protein